MFAGNAMRQANPGAKVLYLRSEQFFSAMIRALQEKTMDQFKRQFQQVDALLIDDIQFFAARTAPRKSSSTPSTRCSMASSRSS